MNKDVSSHYGGSDRLADRIAEGLRETGLDPDGCRARDLEAVDEFHFRGRAATLELLDAMQLAGPSRVLDIGSGLGGVARTIAEATGSHVTGIDFMAEFCHAATVMSRWVGLDDKTEFRQGDATRLPFSEDRFDCATSVHVAMNIRRKDRMYSEVRRVLKPGGMFGIYDILQGDGGDMFYPAPWAGDPSTSFLATPDEMETLLEAAGFTVLKTIDSTRASLDWLEKRTARVHSEKRLPVTIQLLFGERHRDMIENQLRGLRERRMLTCSFICRAPQVSTSVQDAGD